MLNTPEVCHSDFHNCLNNVFTGCWHAAVRSGATGRLLLHVAGQCRESVFTDVTVLRMVLVREAVLISFGAERSQALDFKMRVADAFLSTDRSQFLFYCEALQTLNWAVLPVGSRLAVWISSNFASAMYVESTNEIEVATTTGIKRILNDYKIRSLFSGTGSYPADAMPTRLLSINHLLGSSFIEGALQIFRFMTRCGKVRRQKPKTSGEKLTNL